MGMLLVFVFFLNFFISSSANSKSCSNSFCGNNIYLPIKYPFKLPGQSPKVCNNNYIDLRCDSSVSRTIVLNLPSSGDFYVHDIDYFRQRISLYDPENCLAKRLITLNLSLSPFKAIYYENYTFYNCPKTDHLFYRFKPIHCLSNSSNITVVTASVSPQEMIISYNCSVMFSTKIPVTWYGEYENIRTFNNFELAWNVPYCRECDEYLPPETGGSPNIWSKILRSPLFIPSVVMLAIFLGVACLLSSKKLILSGSLSRATVDNSMIPTILPEPNTEQSTVGTVTMGTDQLKMRYCTESSVGSDVTACTICLEEYHCEETIKYINQCGHCFHSDCIDLWLQKKESCPVCRASLSPVK